MWVTNMYAFIADETYGTEIIILPFTDRQLRMKMELKSKVVIWIGRLLNT